MSLSTRGRQPRVWIGSPPRKQTRRLEATGSPVAQEGQGSAGSEAHPPVQVDQAPGGQAQGQVQVMVRTITEGSANWPLVPVPPPSTVTTVVPSDGGAHGAPDSTFDLRAELDTLRHELQESRRRQWLVEGGSREMLAQALRAQQASFVAQLGQVVERQTLTTAQAQEIQAALMVTAQEAETRAQEAERQRASQELQGAMAVEHVSVQYQQEHERVLAGQQAQWEQRFREWTQTEQARFRGEQSRLQEQAQEALALVKAQAAAMVQQAEDREAQLETQKQMVQGELQKVVVEFDLERQILESQVQRFQEAHTVHEGEIMACLLYTSDAADE